MRGIVFDFFGTLTNPANEHQRRHVYDATAKALDLPGEPFWQAVTSSFTERSTGMLGDTRQTLTEMATRCGATPTSAQLEAAVAVHREGAELLHAPRSDALEVLSILRERGFRLALLSDCSSELCEAWSATRYSSLIDATVFSWAVGYRKPDRRGYIAAADALGVPPTECWFIGDGGSRELWGADAAGMTPVLIANTAYPTHAQYRDDPDAFVPAHVVDDIADVPAVVGVPSGAVTRSG
jgi:putative hydrolase of the HAD superfamily